MIAATKETVPNVAYICFTDTLLDYALEIVEEFAPRYDAIKRGEAQPSVASTATIARRQKSSKIAL